MASSSLTSSSSSSLSSSFTCVSSALESLFSTLSSSWGRMYNRRRNEGGGSSRSGRFLTTPTTSTIISLLLILWLMILQQGILYHYTWSMAVRLHQLVTTRQSLSTSQGQLHYDLQHGMELHHIRQVQIHQIHTRESEYEQLINYNLPQEQKKLEELLQEEEQAENATIYYKSQVGMWNESAEEYKLQAHELHQEGLDLEELSQSENETAHQKLHAAMEWEKETNLAMEQAHNHITKLQNNKEDTQVSITTTTTTTKKKCWKIDWICQQRQKEEVAQQIQAESLQYLINLDHSIQAHEQAQKAHQQALMLLDSSLQHGNASIQQLQMGHELELKSQHDAGLVEYYQTLLDHELQVTEEDEIQIEELQEEEIPHDETQAEMYKIQVDQLSHQVQDEHNQIQVLQQDAISQQLIQTNLHRTLSEELQAYESDMMYTCFIALGITIISIWILIRIYLRRIHPYYLILQSRHSSRSQNGQDEINDSNDSLVHHFQRIERWFIRMPLPQDYHRSEEAPSLMLSQTIVRRDVAYLICHGCLLIVAIILLFTTSHTGWSTILGLAIIAAGIQAWFLHFEVPHVVQACLWLWGVVGGGSSRNAMPTTANSSPEQRPVSAWDACTRILLGLPWHELVRRWILLSALWTLELVASIQVVQLFGPTAATTTNQKLGGWLWWCSCQILAATLVLAYIWYVYQTLVLIVVHRYSETAAAAARYGAPNVSNSTGSQLAPLLEASDDDPPPVAHEDEEQLLISQTPRQLNPSLQELPSLESISRISSTSSSNSRPSPNSKSAAEDEEIVNVSETSSLLSTPPANQQSRSTPSYTGASTAASSSATARSSSTTNEWDTVDLDEDAPPQSLSSVSSLLSSTTSLLQDRLSALATSLLWMATRNRDMPPSPAAPEILLLSTTSWWSEWIKLGYLLDGLVVVWILVDCWPTSFRLVYRLGPVVLQHIWMARQQEQEHKENGEVDDDNNSSREWFSMTAMEHWVRSHVTGIVVCCVVVLLYVYGRMLRTSRRGRTMAMAPWNLQCDPSQVSKEPQEGEDNDHESRHWCCLA